MKKRKSAIKENTQDSKSPTRSTLMAILVLLLIWFILWFWDWFADSVFNPKNKNKDKVSGAAGSLDVDGAGSSGNNTGDGTVKFGTILHQPINYFSNTTGGGGHYTFTQGAASDTWEVLHNLGRQPTYTLYDLSGEEIFGEVTHHETIEYNANNEEVVYYNSLTILFSDPVAGYGIFVG